MELISKNKTLVAVKIEVEAKSKSGLYLGSADESPPLFKVVSANESYKDIYEGDKLLISTSPPKAKFDGVEYYFINYESILAVYRD